MFYSRSFIKLFINAIFSLSCPVLQAKKTSNFTLLHVLGSVPTWPEYWLKLDFPIFNPLESMSKLPNLS